MRTVQARSASQTLAFSDTSSQWDATNYSIGTEKNDSPSSQRPKLTFWVSKLAEKSPAKHKQKGVQGCDVSRAPEGQKKSDNFD